MNSNFQFIKENWPEVFDRFQKAEKFAISDPRTSLTYSRMGVELCINWMYENDPALELPVDKTLNGLMMDHNFGHQVPQKILSDLHLIRKTGNLATHNKSVSKDDSLKSLKMHFSLAGILPDPIHLKIM